METCSLMCYLGNLDDTIVSGLSVHFHYCVRSTLIFSIQRAVSQHFSLQCSVSRHSHFNVRSPGIFTLACGLSPFYTMACGLPAYWYFSIYFVRSAGISPSCMCAVSRHFLLQCAVFRHFTFLFYNFFLIPNIYNDVALTPMS